MALQNIGASNQDDAFYRYKMPKMVTKIEGRGNGIKTNLVNMVDVAKALGRPPAYTTKFFGCELGAQSKFDEKTGTSTVNGSHDTAKLAALLEIFIKKYVQCYGCGNPETEILISKAQMISMKCAACGHVSDVDMRDKLTTFILKNPPEQKKGGKDKKAMRKAEKERLKQGEAIDEEQKKGKKESKKKKGDAVSKGSKKKSSSDEEEHSPPDEDVEANEDNDGVQWQTDTSAEAAKQRIKEQLTLATSEMVMLDVIDDDPKNNRGGKPEAKNASKSPVVVEAEMPCATEKIDGDSGLKILAGLNVHDKLVQEFNEYIQKGCTADQLSDYVQSSSGLQEEVMTALFEALFQGVGKGFAKEATKKLSYLSKVVKDESSQLSLLSAIGAFCEHASADAVKEVALVLKVLYDGDILEEDFIIQWYDNGSAGVEAKSTQMWKYIKPFVEWLRSAEAESEED